MPDMKSVRHPWPAIALPFLALFSAISSVNAALPKVDFDRMGSVGLAGAFAGLDVFDNSSALSFDQSTSTLFTSSLDSGLTRIAATNQGGSIVTSCVLADKVYVAGSFSSLNGSSASNFASYSPSSASLSFPTSNAPNGAIHALFCDQKENKVWAGGDFTSPSPAVALFDPSSSSWSAPPFAGLTGSVRSITTNASASSVFFAGSFVESFGGNVTALANGTNNPNVPFSSGATPFSSSLVPIPLQNASIQGEPSSSQQGFSDINNVLCPAGPDGQGSTWFAADGNVAVVTARAFEFISASGIRLGNTFQGRSTTSFSVATIPDNNVRQLTYVDPVTKQNRTCTTDCPLSTDPSVLYQDFTFDSELSITGVQLTLSAWTGPAPGLHIFQLLSSGAFASAVPSSNGQSCFAPSASGTTHTGDWTELDVPTSISGTQQQVLVANVSVGTPASRAPSVTWNPYVSASGTYDVHLLVPGCTQLLGCEARTSVQVTVFPGGNLQPTITTVDQSTPNDSAPIVYSGPVFPTSDSFSMTVTMTLADSPTGKGQNGIYELVADRVQLVLKSANTTSTGNGAGGVNGTTTGGTRAFGFFEWPLAASSGLDASKGLPNSSLTPSDGLGVALASALGSNTNNAVVNAVAHHSSGAIVFGGSFAAGGAVSNFGVFRNGALSGVKGGGLNGAVNALAIVGDKVFVGGAFSALADGSESGIRGVAVYDISADAWSPLVGNGVDGTVSSLLLTSSDSQTPKLHVAGNFTQPSAGIATFDVGSGQWDSPGGFVVGSMALVGNSTGTGAAGADGIVVAGSVSAALRFGAAGVVMVKNGDGGLPSVTPLGAEFDPAPSSSSPSTVNVNATATRQRRSAIPKRVGPSAWLASFRPRLFTRQSSSTTPSSSSGSLSLPAFPAPAPAPAPAVLAGAFFTNATSGAQIAVLGGNFTSGNARNIALYDVSTGTLSAFNGPQPNGTVSAVFVSEKQVFVGGEFTIGEGVGAVGLAVYDLDAGAWVSGIQALEPPSSSSSTVVVRSITASNAKQGSVVIAGRFASVGGVACAAVCVLDVTSKQWSALGSGNAVLGEVGAVDYAGDNQDILVAAGSLALQGSSTATNVLRFTFGNSSWSAVGDAASELPGPVTALAVNDRNASSIFAAGRTSDSSGAFLSFFDGSAWSAVGTTLSGASEISQLAMVPLQDTHAPNAIVQQDRMLLVSGALQDSAFGSASAALFDGATLVPYVMASAAGGAQGSISQLFHSLSTFSFAQRHLLATGIVILISIAISAGVVFLLVLIGILWTLFARRDDGLAGKLDGSDDDDDVDSAHHRPSSLLAHINAATRTTILAAGADHDHEHHGEDESEGKDPFVGPDASNYLRTETPSEAVAGMMAGEEMPGRPAHARFSFDGIGEGELPLSVGQELEVLDDRDHSWWYARDQRTGREGVVPAAYLY